MQKAVTPIIPANTAMPIAWRISAPAPTEKASGSTPMMKAIEVIRIGRSLRPAASRSEEHTSELQSRLHLVCRLLLEKKKIKIPWNQPDTLGKAQHRHRATRRY